MTMFAAAKILSAVQKTKEHSETEGYLYPELCFELADEAATAALAATVARFAVVTDIIRLHGDLGAGKSTFVRYVLESLGYTGDVPSPTYTLAQLYETSRINVAHLDLYRLEEGQGGALEGLEIERYRAHGLVLAEWPDKAGHGLLADGQPDLLDYHINNPDNGGTLNITLETLETEGARRVTLRGSPSWQRRFGLMFEDCRRPTSLAGRRQFLDRQGLGRFTMVAFPGDWGGRSYARVTLPDAPASERRRILMDSPPPWEGTNDFVAVAAYYRSIGLRAPETYAQDAREGYLLTEDFGGYRLLDLVEAERAGVENPAAYSSAGQPSEAWYRVAVDVLAVQAKAAPMAGMRTYAPKDWWVETARWVDWYVPLATGRAATLDERAQLQQLWAPQMAALMALPQGVMLWDYQITNMMILGDEPKLETFGLIDFQDARIGPVAADLAILLRDIRRSQDDALEARMLDYAAEQLECARAELALAVDVSNLHHCVRIIGGLARAALRDGKPAGAQRFMQRTWDVARQSYGNPALAELVALIAPLEAPGMARLDELAAKLPPAVAA